ncbi:MAG TPA: phage tail protein, partial [Chloroflexota bacterium]|nr:phage tail protein [Chloroflexota bacterium]
YLYQLTVQDNLVPAVGTGVDGAGTNPITVAQTIDLTTAFGGGTFAGKASIFFLPDLSALIIGSGNGTILRFDIASQTVTGTPQPYDNINTSTWIEGATDGVWTAYSTTTVYRFDVVNWELIGTYSLASFGYSSTTTAIVYDGISNSLWLKSPTTGNIAKISLDRISANDVTVGSIVSDLCTTMGGLAAGDIDVTQLTDLVHGYVVTRQAPIRQVIQPLAQAFFFVAVESDFKLKFVKLGANPAVTMTKDDIGAYVGNKRPDPLVITEMPEMQLPRRVLVKYANPGALYQDMTQASQRNYVGTLMESKQETTVEVPAALYDDQARHIADVLLYQAWTRRFTAVTSWSREWLELDPGDVITISKDSVTYTFLITKVDFGVNGVISAELTYEDPSIYTGTAPGAPDLGADPGPGPATTVSGSIAFFMDIVMLRDRD